MLNIKINYIQNHFRAVFWYKDWSSFWRYRLKGNLFSALIIVFWVFTDHLSV